MMFSHTLNLLWCNIGALKNICTEAKHFSEQALWKWGGGGVAGDLENVTQSHRGEVWTPLKVNVQFSTYLENYYKIACKQL